MQPDDVGAIINVARTLKNLNMASEAEKWFYHAIELLPTAESQKAHQQSAKRGVTFHGDTEDDDDDGGDGVDMLGSGQPITRMNPNYLYAFISLANMIKEDPLRMDEADKVWTFMRIEHLENIYTAQKRRFCEFYLLLTLLVVLNQMVHDQLASLIQSKGSFHRQ